jgi:hypothetical protein
MLVCIFEMMYASGSGGSSSSSGSLALAAVSRASRLKLLNELRSLPLIPVEAPGGAVAGKGEEAAGLRFVSLSEGSAAAGPLLLPLQLAAEQGSGSGAGSGGQKKVAAASGKLRPDCDGAQQQQQQQQQLPARYLICKPVCMAVPAVVDSLCSGALVTGMGAAPRV